MMSTSLMGQTGPLREFAGFGNLAGAITGYYELTGWPDRSPAGPFLAYTDYVAPRFAVASLLAALDVRRRTGCGQHLDLAQAEASIHFLAPAMLDHTVNGNHPTRQGNADPWAAPHGVYRCAGDDDWVAIACETDDAARRARRGDRRPRRRRRRGVDDGPRRRRGRADAAGRRRPGARRAEQRGVLRRPATAAPQPLPDGPPPGARHAASSKARACDCRARRRWSDRANPSMGEHNDIVLGQFLGYDEDKITDLVIAGALG